MKIPNVKAMVAKGLTIGMVAGALMLAGPAKAQAQAFGVGVQFGGPHFGYAGPGFVGPGYGPAFYARRGWEREEFARRQAFLRHEEWAHRFGPPVGRFGYYGR